MRRRLAKVVDENGHEIAFGWDRFGLASRLTAAGQLTSAKRGADGLVAEVSASVTGRVDRTVRREHDAHGRVTRVAYAKGEVETFAYDRWGCLSARTRGSLKETYRYDHFGRLAEKDENGTVFSYAYDAWGRRTSRTVRFADGGEALEERRAYDKYGRLVEIAAFGTSVKWRYDAKGRVARQVVDGSPIDFAYTKDGRLAGKWLGGRESPDASVEYEYSRDGRIAARTANGVRQAFAYDARGQLVAVRENGADVERYAYDRAGNMVRKTIRGKTTTFTFDGANQLVSSTTDGVTTRYAYDAAGRLVREGNRTYRYGYLDKVLSVTDGKRSYTYAYHVDGQLARADYGDGRAEGFAWDGLALIRRGDESFVNEPHVGGGNPVVSSRGAAYFNDLLGTTVGVREGRGASWKKSARRYTAAALTAFGEPVPVAATSHNSNIRQFDHSIISSPFFTGKPEVEGLGRVFLYRNYRADLAKWQTADPFGYPDGWNQLAYCGNEVTEYVDLYGGLRIKRKTVEISIEQSLMEPNSLGAVGAGICIPFVSSFFNASNVSNDILKEAEKASMSVGEYIEDWLKTNGVSKFKAKVRSKVENELINILLSHFNNGYYNVNLLQNELQRMVENECGGGWEVEDLLYNGATFDARNGLDGFTGTGAILLASCVHHWTLKLKRVLE